MCSCATFIPSLMVWEPKKECFSLWSLCTVNSVYPASSKAHMGAEQLPLAAVKQLQDHTFTLHWPSRQLQTHWVEDKLSYKKPNCGALGICSTQAVTMVVCKEPPRSPAARESTLQAHLCTKHSLTNAWTLSPLLKKPNNFLSKVGLRLETHGRYPC